MCEFCGNGLECVVCGGSQAAAVAVAVSTEAMDLNGLIAKLLDIRFKCGNLPVQVTEDVGIPVMSVHVEIEGGVPVVLLDTTG